AVKLSDVLKVPITPI
ncbi:hypothetical protein QE152_g41062, partial [Popillia japonica]